MRKASVSILMIAIMAGMIAGCNKEEPALPAATENASVAEALSTDASESKETEAAPTSDYSVEKKETTLYFFGLDGKNTFPLYFFNGKDIPYVDIEDWTDLMKSFVNFVGMTENSNGDPYNLTTKKEGDLVTLIRENDFYMRIDCANDTIHFEDYDGFLRIGEEDFLDPAINSNFRYDGDKEHYIHRGELNNVRLGKELDMNLSAYDIDLIHVNDNYYVPLQTISDILLAPKNVESLYNGENIYILAPRDIGSITNGPSELGESYYSVNATGKISEDLSKFSYNELCFAFDHLYGLKESHNIASFDTLASETGAKDLLTGTDSVKIDEILYQVIYRFLDDQHSKYIMPSYLSGADAANDFGKYLKEGRSRNKTQDLLQEINESATKFYPDGIPAYEEVGDTAYITFNSFSNETQNYYKTAPDADSPDTMGIISYSVSQILRENSPVKRVVLDLSRNTGGASNSAAYTIAAFLGDAEISIENTTTGARVTNVYRADTNLDNEFDENDTLDGKGLQLYCLTSPASFSCGNLVPCVFKSSGKVSIIGKQSGGGSCSIMGLTTAGGSIIRISSCYRISFMKNGAFYDTDQGAPVDFSIRDYDHYYDRKALNKYLDGLY